MWNQLPEKYGKWNSVYRVFNRWSHSGLLTVILSVIAEDDGDQSDEIRALDTSHNKAHQDACRTSLRPEIEGLGKTKGGRNTKISAVTNSKGKATRLEIVPGNEHDNQSAIKTLGSDLEDLIVLADKGYDDQKIRRHVEKNGGRANIPPRSNNKQNIELRQDHRQEAPCCRKLLSAGSKSIGAWLPDMIDSRKPTSHL